MDPSNSLVRCPPLSAPSTTSQYAEGGYHNTVSLTKEDWRLIRLDLDWYISYSFSGASKPRHRSPAPAPLSCLPPRVSFPEKETPPFLRKVETLENNIILGSLSNPWWRFEYVIFAVCFLISQVFFFLYLLLNVQIGVQTRNNSRLLNSPRAPAIGNVILLCKPRVIDRKTPDNPPNPTIPYLTGSFAGSWMFDNVAGEEIDTQEYLYFISVMLVTPVIQSFPFIYLVSGNGCIFFLIRLTREESNGWTESIEASFVIWSEDAGTNVSQSYLKLGRTWCHVHPAGDIWQNNSQRRESIWVREIRI